MILALSDLRRALGAELLAERPGLLDGFRGVSNDSRVTRPGELFVALTTEARDGHDFIADAIAHGAGGLLVHNEFGGPVPPDVAVFTVRDTRHALGELARFWRSTFRVRSIAVAGNVGKTTTKEVIAAMLGQRHKVLKSPANFNDEVGLSMTLFDLEEDHRYAVLETGMFELGEIRRLCQIATPETAVVLNVGPTHLERLGSMEAIAAAKAEAIEGLPSGGNAILNVDDPYVAAMESRTRARVFSIGVEKHAEARALDIRSRGLAGVDLSIACMGRVVHTHSPLPGERLVINALAAVAVCVTEGWSLEEAAHALSTIIVPARLQQKEGATGALILDDSYNASPASMLAALGVLAETGGRHIVLLGDMLELGSAEAEGHRHVGEAAAQVADIIFTIGPRGEQIAIAARESGASSVHHFSSHEEAVAELKAMLGPGDVILIKASHGVALHTVVAELVADET